MSQELKSAVIKGVTMWFRLALMGAIPTIILSLEQGQLDTRAVLITALIASLKALDEVLHKYGKATESTGLSKGLTRF